MSKKIRNLSDLLDTLRSQRPIIVKQGSSDGLAIVLYKGTVENLRFPMGGWDEVDSLKRTLKMHVSMTIEHPENLLVIYVN